MDYETLLLNAEKEGLIVKEKPLKYNNGRIKGNRIAIRDDIETITEKTCVLAEELGHHYTTVGDILDQSDAANRKQERRARLWAYDRLIGLQGIINAYEAGCRNCYEMSDFLGVTEEALSECLDAYREKYGTGVRQGKYYIIFEPILAVGKLIPTAKT